MQLVNEAFSHAFSKTLPRAEVELKPNREDQVAGPGFANCLALDRRPIELPGPLGRKAHQRFTLLSTKAAIVITSPLPCETTFLTSIDMTGIQVSAHGPTPGGK